MSQFKFGAITLVWFGMLLTLATGYLYTPNLRIRRRDDSRAFWMAFAATVPLACLATYLLFQLP